MSVINLPSPLARAAEAGRASIGFEPRFAQQWDDGFVAQYPSAAAFLEMIKDPDYQRAVANRTAALADSRLVRFLPRAEGSGF